MVRRSLILVPIALMWIYASAEAGIIFNRGKKPGPEEQIAELVKTLRTNPDERHRVASIGDLGKFDAKDHPAIATTLIDSVMRDPSSAVRYEAAQALGKVRPLTSQSAYALEYALNNDSSTRVRTAAQNALWQYHVAGYRGPGAKQPPQTAEPGLAVPAARPAAPSAAARPAARPANPRQTNDPPIASSGSTPGIRIDPLADPPKSSLYSKPPAQNKIGSTGPLDPKPATMIVKPEPVQVKPEPAKPAKPAKPDDDGPILIPPV